MMMSSDHKAFFRKKVRDAGITLFEAKILDDFIDSVALE